MQSVPLASYFSINSSRVVHARHAAPAAAVERLDERRQADVLDDAFPIKRILEIAKRLSNDAFFVFLLRQQNRLRHGDAQISRQRVVEKLVVGVPPEWIVDDLRSGEHGALQVSSIERHIVRDSIDDDVVRAGLGHPHAAEFDVLSRDAGVAFVDLVDESLRKSTFAADKYADLHLCSSVLNRGKFYSRHRERRNKDKVINNYSDGGTEH